MMRSLSGHLTATNLNLVDEKTSLIFKDRTQFVTPEALLIHQQRLLDDDVLLDLCNEEYGLILNTPRVDYISKEILEKFREYPVVVIRYVASTSTVYLGVMPEFDKVEIFTDRYKVKLCRVPIYYYVHYRTVQFGTPDFIMELPVTDIWDFIIQEALTLGAADITLTTTRKGAEVYYNVRKKKVHSRRTLSKDSVSSIVQNLATSGGATMGSLDAKPRYFGINLNRANRGRVCINKTYYGMLCTTRVLPNDLFDKTLEDLNVEPHAAAFIRKYVLSREKGLRLFIGETFSGKNTTILSALRELVLTDKYKIVSLEQPVEILVDGIEQINCETDDEFQWNADSLLRQNPDIEYFTEITARTAKSIMEQSNTGKVVFSTIHANSIADVFFRLQDVTKFPIDRLILNVHSLIYQQLERDEATDTIRPVNRCVYISDEIRAELLGKSFGEVFLYIKQLEEDWVNGNYRWV